MRVGKASTGTLEVNNDADWFAVQLQGATITVDIAGDATAESDEGFTVTLSAPSAGATIGTAMATGTIQNDDVAITSTIAIAGTGNSKPEGTGGSTAYIFTVTRSGDTAATQSVQWAAAGATGSGTAPANAADCTGGVLPGGTLTFAPGETGKTITVAINADPLAELNDRFAVTLSSPSPGAVLGTASSGGLILNDDTNIAIAATTAPPLEGDNGTRSYTYTVTRSGITTGSNTLAWFTEGLAPTPATASDFSTGVLPQGGMAFAPGETSKTITVAINGDTDIEPNETFRVRLGTPSNGAFVSVASVGSTIFSEDAALALSPAGNSKPEGTGGSTAYVFTVVRSGGDAISHSVAWAVAGASGPGTLPATADDFAGGAFPSGTLVIGNGEASRTITVPVAADAGGELNERFTLTLSSPSAGAVIAKASAQGVILNDDTSLAVVATSPDQAEGNSGSKTYSFAVQRSGNWRSQARCNGRPAETRPTRWVRRISSAALHPPAASASPRAKPAGSSP